MSIFSSPSVAKKIEKEITRESIKEDKLVQHALKDLGHLEKQSSKAQKKADETEKALDKAEIKQDGTLRALNKYTQRHEDAVDQVERRSRELATAQSQEDKVHQALKLKKVQVEEVMRRVDEHEKGRMARLKEVGGLDLVNPQSTSQEDDLSALKGPDPRQLH